MFHEVRARLFYVTPLSFDPVNPQSKAIYVIKTKLSSRSLSMRYTVIPQGTKQRKVFLI
jgi:hypothetical protein